MEIKYLNFEQRRKLNLENFLLYLIGKIKNLDLFLVGFLYLEGDDLNACLSSINYNARDIIYQKR